MPADTVETLFIQIPQFEKLATEHFLSFWDTAQKVREKFEAPLKAKMGFFKLERVTLLWGSPIDAAKATPDADVLQGQLLVDGPWLN